MDSRKYSYPPFIVFFDAVAIILFMLLLNQNQGITVDPPERFSLRDAEYARFSSGQVLVSTQTLQPIKQDMPIAIPCGGSVLCGGITSESGEMMVLPDRVNVELAKVIYWATQNGCKKLNVVLRSSGQVDRVKTAEENSCVKKIAGYEVWIKNQM